MRVHRLHRTRWLGLAACFPLLVARASYAADAAVPPATTQASTQAATAGPTTASSGSPLDDLDLSLVPKTGGAKGGGGGGGGGGNDLAAMSLEDLMNVEVTSVSKQKERVLDAPAAVTVISQDDIRRSGLTSIPELLRLSPGLEVARASANQWAISSRGFNSLFDNKLLVLMDGRTLYNPAFSGVYWDTPDYLLPDLERIEVIRGPGATLWGANAVNGVINITTKSAKETQGLLVDGTGATDEQVGGARYGGKLDDRTYYRVYGMGRRTDDFLTAANDEANDGWQSERGGFRIDRYSTDQDVLTLQGDIFSERATDTFIHHTFVPPFTQGVVDPINQAGGNVLGRWTHTISDKSDFSVQFYYDHFSHDETFYDYSQDVVDVDVQHRFPLGERQEVIWGGGGRVIADSFNGSVEDRLSPVRSDHYIVNAFVQDDVTVVPKRVHVIVGSKFEDNSHTGFEIEPGVRTVWTPDDRQAVWGAVSRAVRTPSRIEEDANIFSGSLGPPVAPLPTEVRVLGNDELASEELTAFEVGYRLQATDRFSIDVATFYNRYDKLIGGGPTSTTLNTATFPPTVVVDVPFHNGASGYTTGGEVSADWRVRDDWRLNASYSFIDLQIQDTPIDTTGTYFNGSSPRNQFQVHSYVDVAKNVEWNTGVYYVERLKTDQVPSYVRLDTGITWRPRPGLELAAGVQNLLDDRHPEFGNTNNEYQTTEVPRSYYARLTWQY